MSVVQTFSGKLFDLRDPQPEQVSIVDIAHALSQQVRFAGHAMYTYSVAQHSLACAELAQMRGESASVQLQALMHDSAETYVLDIHRPLKAMLSEHKPIEYRVQLVIEQALDLPHYPGTGPVKEIDHLVLIEEGHQLLKGGPIGWGERERPLDIPMVSRRLEGFVVAELFLRRYHELQAVYRRTLEQATG